MNQVVVIKPGAVDEYSESRKTTDSVVRKHWSADNNFLFPHKLWDAASSGKSLISWNEQGDGVVMNEREYEARVMTTYPDLVYIPTFLNIRRQFREYGFSWSYDAELDEYMFTHRFFQRKSPELLSRVTTRRKRAKLCKPVLVESGVKRSTRFRKTPFNSSTPNGYRPVSMVKPKTEVKACVKCVPESATTTPVLGKLLLPFVKVTPLRASEPVVESRVSVPIQTSEIQPAAKRPRGRPKGSGLKKNKQTAEWVAKAVETKDDDQRAKADELVWENCLPWLYQHDAELRAAYDLECLEAAMRTSHPFNDLPVYFYGDETNYNPNSSQVYFDSKIDDFYGIPVINIVPDECV